MFYILCFVRLSFIIIIVVCFFVFKYTFLDWSEVHWNDLIDSIGPNQRLGTINLLREKLITLGNDHYPHSVFPVPFVLRQFEKCSRALFATNTTEDVYWVADALLRIGLPHHTLIRYYWDMCSSLVRKKMGEMWIFFLFISFSFSFRSTFSFAC
jgi:hypothetical protein